MGSATDGDGAAPWSIEAAVWADVQRWDLAGTALAASALDMARTLDSAEVSPTPRSMLHAQLRMTLMELRRLAPPQGESDGIDELAARRRERRGA